MENTNWMKYLKNARIGMIAINFLIVFFYLSVVLLGTRYVIDGQMSKMFLMTLVRLPFPPVILYWITLGLFGMLSLCMHIWTQKKHASADRICPIVEGMLCFMILVNLSMVYNGLILLIFCDCLYHTRQQKLSYPILIILVTGFFLCNHDVISSFMPICDISKYLAVFPNDIHVVMKMFLSSMETMNVIAFIVFLICYIAEELQEKENIQKELDMMQNVNRQLQDYAAITEKLGESNERKRLAREIHDTLGHALTGIAAGVDACIAMIDRNPDATKKQLFVVSRVVRQGIGDVRNSLNKLRPGALEEKGLKGAVENMIAEMNSLGSISITLDYEVDGIDLDKTKEDALFRMIQESTTNAIRHGHAHTVAVHLFLQHDTLCLDIQDDGIGCEKITYGFGLKQMKERVSILSGTVEFDGSNGFLTKIRIPLQKGELYDQSIDCR